MSWIGHTSATDASWTSAGAIGNFRATTATGGLTQEVERIIASTENGDFLRLISPVLDDPTIVSLLCEARCRGVLIQLMTSLFDSRKGIVTKGWDESQNIQAHYEAIRELAKVGVLLRSPSTTPHIKLVHLESREAFFGSANLAKTSLRGGSVEAGVRISETLSLLSLREAFQLVWNSCQFSMGARFGAVTLQEQARRSSELVSLTAEWACEDATCLWLSQPGAEPIIATRLAEFIAKAQRDVILVALSCYDTDRIPGFGIALHACLRRGVRVRVVVRPEHFRINQYPDLPTISLIEEGMELVGVRGLHAKGFLIDNSWCGIQSANFNPYSLDTGCATSNVEMAISGPRTSLILSDFADFILALSERPTHQFASL